jgi:hypothetical protein
MDTYINHSFFGNCIILHKPLLIYWFLFKNFLLIYSHVCTLFGLILPPAPFPLLIPFWLPFIVVLICCICLSCEVNILGFVFLDSCFFLYFYCCVGGGMSWHLQKFLQYFKYEVTPSTVLLHPLPPSTPPTLNILAHIPDILVESSRLKLLAITFKSWTDPCKHSK